MSDFAEKPAGSCKHRPISNGWSQQINLKTGESRSSSWCGYCRAVVDHDAEWLAKFIASGRSGPAQLTPTDEGNPRPLSVA